MSKIKSNERNAAKEALAAMMASASAPGIEQAQIATRQKEQKQEEPESAVAKNVEVTPVVASETKPDLKEEPKEPEVLAMGEGKAEKISISLHPADLIRLEEVEDALRKSALIPRRAPTSFLLKVALAAFDQSQTKRLVEAVAEVNAQDGRRK
jgi:hypothetical protein